METTEEIEATLNHHFFDIMCELRQDIWEDIKNITRLIPFMVTNEQNDLLMNIITLNEVEEAVFQMKEGIARGPDGFTVIFFHRFWEMVNMDVWRILEESRIYGLSCQCLMQLFLH